MELTRLREVGLALPHNRNEPAGPTRYALEDQTASHQGVNGFDSGRSVKGSVQVQARDHLKRHRKKTSAKTNSQREFALAA
jgi:hypothetical protein